MEKIADLGYFLELFEFYEMWATNIDRTKNFSKLSKIEKLALKYCTNKEKVRGFFSQLKEEDDQAENTIAYLKEKPIAEKPQIPVENQVVQEKVNIQRLPVPRQPLAVVNEESYESRCTVNSSGDRVSSNNSIPVNSSPVVAPPSPEARPVIQKAHPANYSFTTHLFKNEVDIFGQTLPLSQEARSSPVKQGHPTIPVQENKDFSIFADHTEKPEPRGIQRPYIKEENSISESPLAKRSRENLLNSPSTVNPPSVLENQEEPKFESPHFGAKRFFDEKTVAGMGKADARMASTPSSKTPSKPMFEVSPTKIFPAAAEPEKDTPFTFAPIAAQESPAAQPVVKEQVPISDALRKMTLAQAEEDLETTRDFSVCPDAQITSGVNPWGEKERLQVLKHAPPMVEQHEFLTTKCPLIKVNATISLGGENYKILKLIGQGGFARVYKAENDEKKSLAIKLEMPPCPWEVYICKSVVERLEARTTPFVMNVLDAYIFSNASAIIYDYHPKKTLLELSNNFGKEKSLIDPMVVGFIGSQIAEVIGYIHRAKIIHSDIKPDNFVVLDYLTEDEPRNQYGRPFVKLIDWGRGIDMSYFKNQTFKGRAGTDGFDCSEMIEGRPWTYQTDYYGFIGTIHVLIFGAYMKTLYSEAQRCYVIKEVIKR